jgi:hypothetical protein
VLLALPVRVSGCVGEPRFALPIHESGCVGEPECCSMRARIREGIGLILRRAPALGSTVHHWWSGAPIRSIARGVTLEPATRCGRRRGYLCAGGWFGRRRRRLAGARRQRRCLRGGDRAARDRSICGRSRSHVLTPLGLGCGRGGLGRTAAWGLFLPALGTGADQHGRDPRVLAGLGAPLRRRP